MRASSPSAAARSRPSERLSEFQRPALAWASAAVPPLALATSSIVLAFACVSFAVNYLDPFRLVAAGALAFSLALLTVHGRYEEGAWRAEPIVLLLAALIAIVVLARLPEYAYGHSVNGVVHRSFFTAFILLAVALPSVCAALYWVLGATPSARDASRYPLVLLPAAFAAFAYGLILIRLVQKGYEGLSWHIVSHEYYSTLVGRTIENQAGMRNHILGTLLLIVMTALIALPVGVGSGVFVSEYEGPLARVVGFCTAMLRAISVFILAASAFSLVKYTGEQDTTSGVWNSLSHLIQGSYRDAGGFSHPAKGSFLMASAFLALLVIPVIARATEEGLRSIPRDIREGSRALGATEGHALLRILLPWSLPNIVTGLLLGTAEAAGSVTVLLFISGTGQYGLGPRHEATSLAYLIFDAGRGTKSFTDVMHQYQFSAALLLLGITFGLTIGALALKQRFADRYRAGILSD